MLSNLQRASITQCVSHLLIGLQFIGRFEKLKVQVFGILVCIVTAKCAAQVLGRLAALQGPHHTVHVNDLQPFDRIMEQTKGKVP